MARNKYPEVTVEKILDVAQRLFLEKGYENTTIQDIVDELGGLTKGAVYHHFKSKEEIMDAVGDRMFSVNNPFEKVKKRSDLNGLEKLRESVGRSPHGYDDTIYPSYQKSSAFSRDDQFQPTNPYPILSGTFRRRKQRRFSAHGVYQRNCGIDAVAYQFVAASICIPGRQGRYKT